METKATTTERIKQTRPRKNAATKSRARKTAPAAKRAVKTAAARKSASNGYGQSAAKLMRRGKAAIGTAYSWAGEAGQSLPRTARNLHLPAHGSMQDYVSDRPLILGAVGLGLGMALGAMLPIAAGMRRTVPRRARRK